MVAQAFRGFRPWSLGLISSGLRQHCRAQREHVAEEACSPRGGWEANGTGRGWVPMSA